MKLNTKEYEEKMKKETLKIREECSDMNAYMAALNKKGGTSIGAAILSLVAVGIIQTAIYACFIFLL